MHRVRKEREDPAGTEAGSVAGTIQLLMCLRTRRVGCCVHGCYIRVEATASPSTCRRATLHSRPCKSGFQLWVLSWSISSLRCFLPLSESIHSESQALPLSRCRPSQVCDIGSISHIYFVTLLPLVKNGK